MNHEPTLKTRREFLRTTVLGSALSWTVPTFLAKTFSSLHAAAADAATQVATGRDSTILVVLQLAGGNDGLNTVVPFADDFYHKARPRLALAGKDLLKLDDTLGLHPALKGLKALYDAGHLAVVQGVGYPNPNRSHFRSTEIWQTASDANRFESTGWLGRYFDNTCSGCDPAIAVALTSQMPQAFAGEKTQGHLLHRPAGVSVRQSRFARRGRTGHDRGIVAQTQRTGADDRRKRRRLDRHARRRGPSQRRAARIHRTHRPGRAAYLRADSFHGGQGR